MQTTLLGMAVALILALVAALVGPYLVDWARYRSEIEAQASRFVGAPVEVSGPIVVRLLPTPSLALHSVAVSAGGTQFSARSVRIELALGPLMQGEWQVSELALGEPRLRLGLDRSGALPPLPFPAGLDPERVAVDRLAIEDGRIVLSDAESERTLAVEKFYFNGELRSLAGPLRGAGRFSAPGGAYRFRLNTSRIASDRVKLRLSLDVPDWPLIAETDGTLSVEGDRPRFEGVITLSGPAGAVLADGRAVARDPWRATAHMRADPRQAEIDDLELNYGPEDRLLRLSGRAEVALAPAPRFAVTLAGHQMLLDRLTDPTAAAGGSPLQALPAMLGGLLKGKPPPLPGRLDLAIDQVTFAGSSVQSVQAVATADADGWTVTRLDFRAPGATQVQLGGRLRAGSAGLVYAGPVRVESAEPGALLSFLEGKTDAARPPLGPLVLSGEAAINDREVRLERMQVTIDGRPIEGNLAYVAAAAGSGSRLDANVAAAEVDLDSATALAKGTLAGIGLEWPRTMALALRISRLTYSGVDAGRVDAKLKLDPNGLAIERFTIGDLRGANVTATGLVDIGSASPHGTLSVALTAARAEGLAALASRFAPQAADEINRYAVQLGSADLHAKLEIAPDRGDSPDKAMGRNAGSEAKLVVDGKLGAVRISLNATARGARDALAAATVKATGSLEAADGKVLAALTGADRLVAIEARPVLLTLSANGTLDGALGYDLRLAAGGLSAAGTGTVRLVKGEWAGTGDMAVTATDARPLLNAGAKAALPATLDAHIGFAGPAVTIDAIRGRLGDAKITGRLALTVAAPISVDGRIDATDIDVGSVIAVGLSAPRVVPAEPSRTPNNRVTAGREPVRAPGALLPAPIPPPPFQQAQDPATLWPVEPFAPTPLFARLRGRIAFAAENARLLPGLQVNKVKGSARFDGPSVTLENLTGAVADGTLAVDAVVQAVPAGLSMQAKMSVAKADLAQIDFGRSKPPASGRVSLTAEVSAVGRSPATLIGALHGSGQLGLDKAQIAGFDPHAIDGAISAVDRGLPLERLAGYLGPALEAGTLPISSASAQIDIADGQVRVAPVIVRPEGTEVVLSATYNLATDVLDAQVTLAGKPREDLKGQRPEVTVTLRGPLSAPERTIEAAPLTSYVTLQAVEREAKRVEAAEREARRRDALAAARVRAEREQAAQQRAEEARRAEEERRSRERGEPSGGGDGERQSASAPDRTAPPGSAPAGAADADVDRAPALPAPIEIKPQPISPSVRPIPSPKTRPAEAPSTPPPPPPQILPRRSFWDELFSGR